MILPPLLLFIIFNQAQADIQDSNSSSNPLFTCIYAFSVAINAGIIVQTVFSVCAV